MVCIIIFLPHIHPLQGTWLLQMAATLYQPTATTDPTDIQPLQQEPDDILKAQDLFFAPIISIDTAPNEDTSQNDVIPSVVMDSSADDNDLLMFHTMFFAWHCILSVIVITFFHALMRAISVCVYRGVLQRKLTKGEDTHMLDASAPRENV